MNPKLRVNNTSRLFESPANLYLGFEGVGGRLALTTEYLYFKPHAVNIQKDEKIINLKEIVRVEKTKTLGIIPNGMKVIAMDNEYRFIVKKRNQWVAEINKQIKIAHLKFENN